MTETQQKILLASQPIYDSHKDVYGFELLLPASIDLSPAGSAPAAGREEDIFLNLATGITEQTDIYCRPIFIRLPDTLLLSDPFMASLSPQSIIEIPPHIRKHDLSLAAIEKWRSYGYRFVLDDFDFSGPLVELLCHFDYVRLDANKFSPADLAAAKRELVADVPPLCVKNIETEADYQAYAELGTALFQGYFLARPTAVRGVALRNKVNQSISLAQTVTHPDIEVKQLVEAVSSDPSLAAQILKIINSPLCALKRPVSSLKEAVVYLGLGQVRKWILLMALLNSEVADKGTIRLILTRAKSCERYAAWLAAADSEQAFLAGLVSGVELLFGIEAQLFLQQVSLDPAIVAAVLRYEGLLGMVLTDILAMERRVMETNAIASEYCDEKLISAHMAASSWAEKVMGMLPG